MREEIADTNFFFDRSTEPNPPGSTEQDRFTSLFNILRDHEEFTLNVHGMIMSSNLEAVSITGYEEWEVIGQSIALFYTADDMAAGKPQADLLRSIEVGRLNLAGWRVKKKGKSFWAKVRIQALFNDEGRHTGFKMTLRDATHNVMYNYRVKNIRSEYLNLFNNSFIGIFKFRYDDGRLLIMNEKALEIFGCDTAQTLHFEQLFKNSCDFTRLADQLAKGEKVEGFEFQIKAEKANRWVSVSCRHFQEGNFVEGIVLDISENKKQVIELKRLNHELDQLIYHSSHDLRSPLTTIMGLVNLIHLDRPSTTVEEYTNMIGERIGHLDALLKDLVSITYHSKAGVESEVFHFQREIEDILNEVKDIAPHVRIKMEPSPNTRFHTDPVRMRTVLKNLLSNALKFHNPTLHDPYVKIGYYAFPDSVQIVVEDNGIGIPASFQKNVFEMFFKGATTNGTGLGLYIVRLLVEAMDGSIELESTEGLGAMFRIILPNPTTPHR